MKGYLHLLPISLGWVVRFDTDLGIKEIPVFPKDVSKKLRTVTEVEFDIIYQCGNFPEHNLPNHDCSCKLNLIEYAKLKT